MRIGVLPTGDSAVRAAHSLAAHPGVEEVVVIGPATSTTFSVVKSAEGCDLLVGSGPTAPRRAQELSVPLIWDGEDRNTGVAVFGGSPQGLAIALASRESDPQLIAVAHPWFSGANDRRVRFPDPVGRVPVNDGLYSGRRVATAKSPNQFAAVLVNGASRRVAIVDDGAYLAGIALAAAVELVTDTPQAVWDDALPYLKTVVEMGLVMAKAA